MAKGPHICGSQSICLGPFLNMIEITLLEPGWRRHCLLQTSKFHDHGHHHHHYHHHNYHHRHDHHHHQHLYNCHYNITTIINRQKLWFCDQYWQNKRFESVWKMFEPKKCHLEQPVDGVPVGERGWKRVEETGMAAFMKAPDIKDILAHAIVWQSYWFLRYGNSKMYPSST